MSTQSVTTNSGLGAGSLPSVKPKRYHPALVALHWLIAILIFGTALLAQENEGGRERFGEGRNFPQPGAQQVDPPQQGFPQGGFPPQAGGQNIFSRIGLHMILGISILGLLVIRLIVRWLTKRPTWASTGNKLFDWVGELTHLGLYILSFAMVITGIILASQRGQLARVLGIGTFTPGSFRRGGFSLGIFHGGVWTLLVLLVILHIGAALYHQFILKDNLMGRIWFGKQTEGD
ncbi:MAG TPA: cytochrome b/b6 domain-containing protein [Anaerolineales bacterium]|nr:cytochrome b/b6 domain-containing protein [Anaerolineales bacterium]